MKYVALVVLAAGCFSEPDRPHGVGLPIVAGSIVRHKAVVGDLNNDGYDDLVLFGNDVALDTHPTLFVYFGGESLENPDLRIDVSVTPDDAAAVPQTFDVIDASFVASTDGTRGIAVMTAEEVDTNGAPAGLVVYPEFVPFDGRTAGPPVHGDPINYAIETDPPSDSDYVAVMRDTEQALPAHEMLFGGRGVMFAAPAPLDISHRAQRVDFMSSEQMQGVLVLPPSDGHEDLLYIGDMNVLRTTGDRDPALGDSDVAERYPTGNKVALPESNNMRETRGRAGSDGHFWATTTTPGLNDGDVPIIDVPATGPPVVYGLTPTAQTDDVSVANVGGGDAIDLVALESGTLGVYRDLALDASGKATPAATIGNPTELQGYDILAVGNFHGTDQLEIYATSDLHPESRLVCYHLNDQLDPCADE
jgi:hypothetical protein